MQFSIVPLICPSPIGNPLRTAALVLQGFSPLLNELKVNRRLFLFVFIVIFKGTSYTCQTEIQECRHTMAHFSLQAASID